jgi:hypothetical protein
MNRTILGTCKRNRNLLFTACGAALMWAGAPAAQAEEFNLIQQKGQVSLGTFFNGNDIKISVDGEAGEQGTTVDWGNTFGRGEETRFRLDGLWRFNDRHHMRFMYTDFSLTNEKTASRDIEWNGDLIPIDSTIKGGLSFEIIELAYEYAFRHTDKYELTGSAGLHYATFGASLTADVTAPGGGGTVALGGKASVDLPLPVFGAHGIWRMGQNFYFDAHAQFFFLTIDEYGGDIINYRAALIWQPKKLLGVGVGYDSFQVKVDVNKTNFTGTIDWTYSGPQVFLNFAF